MGKHYNLERNETCPDCGEKFTKQGIRGHLARKHGKGDALPPRQPPSTKGKRKAQTSRAAKSAPNNETSTLERSTPPRSRNFLADLIP
jgi:hypothetical protein